jgi:hypothetical protein
MGSTTAARRTRLRGRHALSGAAPSRHARWRRRGLRALRTLRRAPVGVQLLSVGIVVGVLWFAANGVYQVARKPTELLVPVTGTLSKTPAATWEAYGSTFQQNATSVMTPALLAALAQVEGAGDPAARTRWRWRPSWNPFELYRPASSAVGMYQITDGTFREAKRYCIHDHAVVEDGPWYDMGSCWFNALYTRTVPSHAVEMTSAFLDRQVERTLERRGIPRATLGQKQDLAAVIHLCGAGVGEAYAVRRFRLTPHQRCGDQDVRAYLARVSAMKRVFDRLAASR